MFGSLDVVSAFDLLEWLCSNRKSWLLRLFTAGVDGHAAVVDGQLLDARWGSLHGLPALAEIVGCRRAQFDLVPVPSVTRQTLHGRWQGLLLSAAHLLDERRLGNPAPSDSPPPVSQPPVALVESVERPGLGVDELIDRGFLALRAGDRDGARRCWRAALAQAPGHRTLQFNLRKLESDGPRKAP